MLATKMLWCGGTSRFHNKSFLLPLSGNEPASWRRRGNGIRKRFRRSNLSLNTFCKQKL
ncbi:hypothetical protein KCP77_05090 [Salmonella enterica subsp. enterica]|nr:hypothetical protein KCP77_05090 [Salmonella enterica subsp. enterica]